MAKQATDNVPPVAPDIARLSFEDALAELEEIVSRLEGGDVGLEESIDIYTRGAMLKRHCDSKLRAAEEKIEKIVLGADGTIGAEPVEAD
jgi:exodeoxyribonuclease VII small subunit